MEIAFNMHWHGLRCLELVADQDPSPELFRLLAGVARWLQDNGVADGAVSSYRSVAVYWDSIPRQEIEQDVMAMAAQQACIPAADPGTVHTVPIRYSGIDLCRVAEVHAMSPEEVIRRHSSAVYTVAAVGFLPHFGYLWGLDAELVTPRLPVPRPRVPLGAVGIGGGQTGIYPGESPGGWNLIGQVEEAVCREVCRQLGVGDGLVFKVLG
jgi:KipI family sensor histidine kinase inhibitor